LSEAVLYSSTQESTHRADAPKKVLVATDGSRAAQKAVKYAADISARFGSDIVILSVYPHIELPLYPSKGFDDEDLEVYKRGIREAFERALKEAESLVSEGHPELKYGTRIEEGRPSDIIVEVAEEEGADLIVVGSRGIGGIRGWILGSTSRSVLHSAKGPVLIVK